MLIKIVLTVLFAINTTAIDGLNCQCAPNETNSTLESAYQEADIVFLGRVVSRQPSPLRKEQIEVKLSVYKKFKNDPEGEEARSQFIVVYTPKDEALCSFSFFPEQDYLIFAKGNPANYKVTKCSRSAVVESARDDIDHLMKLYDPTPTRASKN